MVELIKVPKSIFMQVNPAPDVYELMDNFFINAKEYVQSRLVDCRDSSFEIKSANLAYGPENVISNNRINYIEFREKYIIAGMLETRTRFNDVQFTFFRDLSFLREDL